MISNTSQYRRQENQRMLPAQIGEPDFIVARFRIFDFQRRRFTLLQIRLQRKGPSGDWSPEVQRQEFDGFAGADDLLQSGAEMLVSQIVHLDVHLSFSGKHITFSKTTVCSNPNQLVQTCVRGLLDFRPASPRLKFFKRLHDHRKSRCASAPALEPNAVLSIHQPRTYTVTT